MTRWARSGSTQKHRKMPGDATPWEEFAKNIKGKAKNDNSVHGKVIRTGRIEKKKHKLNKFFPPSKSKMAKEYLSTDISRRNTKEQNLKEEQNLVKKSEGTETGFNYSHNVNNFSECSPGISFPSDASNSQYLENNIEVSTKNEHASLNVLLNQNYSDDVEAKKLAKKQLKKAKRQRNLTDFTRKGTVINLLRKKENECIDQNNKEIIAEAPRNLLSSESNEIIDSLQVKQLYKSQLKKAKRKKAKLDNLETEKLDLSFPQEMKSENQSGIRKIISDDGACNRDKKKLRKEEHSKKKPKSGIRRLPTKVEDKINNLKRKLQEQELPLTEINDIIKKQRRSAKRRLRKTFREKSCFKCRKIGHLFAECPLNLKVSNQESKICFKCGSTEHMSSKCKREIEGYPLAKCFICKEQGHISRDCPNNKHGIYPDGGKCNWCGNINHLKKDCPSLLKKKEEIVLKAHTIDQGKSIDDEIIEFDTKLEKKTFKQLKIVKF